jgi:hypothetical protein
LYIVLKISTTVLVVRHGHTTVNGVHGLHTHKKTRIIKNRVQMIISANTHIEQGTKWAHNESVAVAQTADV